MRFLFLPPIIMLFTGLGMVVLDRRLPLARLWDTPYSWAGLLLVVVGLAIAKWHAGLFKKIGTNIQTFGEPGTMTRAGMFRVSRNPMYLGFVLALLGEAIILGSASAFLAAAAFAALTNYWYIPFEERAMLQRFGQEYIDYKNSVRRWL